MLKKQIRRSKKLAGIKNDKARVLYFMILPHLSVNGRLSGDPVDIKADCVPLFDWDIKTIETALRDLHNSGLVIWYEVEGAQYIEFTRFSDFQTLNKSREAACFIPPPPDNSGVIKSDSRQIPLSLSLSLSKEHTVHFPPSFTNIWRDYPSKIGKREAYRHYKASVKSPQDEADIKKALENYKKSDRVARGYIQNGSTWFNNWRDWVEDPERKVNEHKYRNVWGGNSSKDTRRKPD